MENKHILFSFDAMTGKDAGSIAVKRSFARAGSKVVGVDGDGPVKRAAGVSYRELRMVFGDGQTVTMRVKQTGDIYQVLLNDRLIPIKSQNDHEKAIAEIAKAMDNGRESFQKKLAATLVKPPPGIRTAAPKMEAILTERRDSLKEAIAAARDKLAGLVPEQAGA